MTNLTEQWKKGELPSGWYYITTSFADEALKEYFDGDEFRTVFTCNVKEVLAQVPSYEEWQAKLEENTKLKKWCEAFNALEVVIENAQLKSLLKECVEVLNDAQRNCGYNDSILDICSPIITKINQVLGEE